MSKVRRVALRALSRLGAAITVIWVVATITFFAVRAVPGDPVQAILGGPGSQASAEAVAQARADYGLDRPLGEQYFAYLGQLLRGDLGVSYRLHDDVTTIIGDLLPNTLQLAGAALVLGWAIALLLVWLSTRGGRVAGVVTDFLGIVGAALPHFWLGAVLITIFATGLGLPVALSGPGFTGLILPALTLAIPLGGYLAQVMRDSTLDALDKPFVLAARARGESPNGVFRKHLLRRAALPAVGLTGWAFGSLISGAVVVEKLFARPGLGRSLVDAVVARDVPLVIGVLIVVAAAYVLITLVTDVIEQALSPRTEAAV
ncbi:ABC transporter permease [Gulosibacter molinativorax]|uniref:ABC transporter permease n=1 Tax=Gulosibacter molinativorax TaxID=256821 RepID=A0ABT7CAF6_9MICO|nr:ABC transporter permease [Gulosibacter molinativorax]MDJ1372172.1 ABC transporter permease [Gulosibacter molinativorax]QUY60957.1 Nickel transport system permease protein NikB [Gulosibacter molinativorax]